jgi:integrase
VRPIWGSLNIRDVRTIAVENWLRRLQRAEGRPLANSTKAKIRSLMSVLFNHAIRHEWLEQGRNPILLVRQSAKRQRIPDWLEPEELTALLSQLDPCFRLMVFLDAVTGLRRSELLALKWGDVEFENLQIIVQRSIYRNVVGNCKTEASKKPVPMDPILAAELWTWKRHSSYSQPYDWVFASSRTKGKNPYWPDIILSFSCGLACCGACWNSKACRLAHVPAQLFDDIDRKRRKREGGARTHAAFELSVHTGNLLSSSKSGEAGRPT